MNEMNEKRRELKIKNIEEESDSARKATRLVYDAMYRRLDESNDLSLIKDMRGLMFELIKKTYEEASLDIKRMEEVGKRLREVDEDMRKLGGLNE